MIRNLMALLPHGLILTLVKYQQCFGSETEDYKVNGEKSYQDNNKNLSMNSIETYPYTH